MTVRVIRGDCREMLLTLESGSVQCCVTSPPYFNLRDYGVAGQIGLESSPTEYVQSLVGVFREVRRVLRDDGTLWVNIGDSYAASPSGHAQSGSVGVGRATTAHGVSKGLGRIPQGLKPKDLIGIPWLLAFALRADGWYLRSDIIWHKPNVMPESVKDRPTKSHEYLFLLSKGDKYFYDAAAIAEAASENKPWGKSHVGAKAKLVRNDGNSEGLGKPADVTRNKRSVWTIPTSPLRDAHFAAFPPKLVEPCILAGSERGGTVLDPFFGAGTTGLVADRLGRDCIGIELNEKYATMARTRIIGDAPLFVGDVA